MRTVKQYSIIIISLVLLSGVLLTSCGQPIADALGCPAGTYLANSTDIITGPADVNFTGLSVFNNPYPGGTVNLAPLTFIVTDSRGVPRNNVCLLLYTGDTSASPGPFWYADANYAAGAVIYGAGPFNARTVVTNDAGGATVYWSTATLPAAIPKTMDTVGPPPTYIAGGDLTGTSFIQVDSGAQSLKFNVNWTVQGEPES
ncbi:MAG: hypothetical protein OEW15_04600 [Nitrospirota bacterium]|nr:hypothetical protein [Nitrospirota bacterium]